MKTGPARMLELDLWPEPCAGLARRRGNGIKQACALLQSLGAGHRRTIREEVAHHSVKVGRTMINEMCLGIATLLFRDPGNPEQVPEKDKRSCEAETSFLRKWREHKVPDIYLCEGCARRLGLIW